jgi:ABC-type polysaccharide/polyol phosphate transport system ATPase subunit
MDAVTVENVSKNYRIYAKPSHRLRELLFRQRKLHRDFWALKRVSFKVRRSSTFGVIGENGSGKSTLLQIIAGTLQPTEGTIGLNGRVAALLELGAGFNPEFTGRENVFLNGAILGLSQQQIAAKLPEIERFAEIGSFIDQPVKTYSSGMYVRLAFAISINVDPEILLVDESLSVGDVYFQQRCMWKIRQMKLAGKTILFVSHDLAAVKNLCDTALWLEQGEIKMMGEPEAVVSRYLAAMTRRRDPYVPESYTTFQPDQAMGGISTAAFEHVVQSIPNVDHRWGDGRAELLGIQLLAQDGRIIDTIDHGEVLTLRLSVRFNQLVNRPSFGFVMRNRLGEDIAATNTSVEGIKLPPASSGQICTADFHMKLPLLHSGNYSFSVAVADGTHDEYVICDWVDNAISMVLTQRQAVYGYIKFDCRIELKQISAEVATPEKLGGRV